MKNLIQYSVIIIITVTAFFGCNYHQPTYYVDTIAPHAPSGLTIYNGDERVDISWIHNRESDLAGYNIYYSRSYDGKYTLIGSSSSNYFVDYDVYNGEIYYYAVTAYDFSGNESELSRDFVYAAPRPEGFNQAIFNYRNFPNNSGYSFYNFTVVPYDDLKSDFFFENYNGTFYLNVWDDTDIIDMGPTNDIYDILYAPVSGWSSTKDVIVSPGNTYVIWTWDNHFAKVRVKNITRDRIVFDWAFQLVKGERLLKAKPKLNERIMTRTFSR
jgi:hypothetical protein